ncbi:hypothetical protein BC828DRAFT_406569 [Blastocladiella britannica]|nr:hypothetical protein BC828DRAFT_406569 [Blastocladiella britannica]
MLNNEDRRHFMVLIRIYSRQWLSVDFTIPDDTSIRSTRGALMDSQMYHALLSNDPGGLSYQFPELTVQPRDCARNPSLCHGIVEMPEIGYNYALAGQPMNAEISQFFDMATLVCNYMATSNNGRFDPIAEQTFDLTDVISSDIEYRVNDLAMAIMNKFITDIHGSTNTVIITFVATLLVYSWCMAMLLGVILRRLNKEAHATATLLYMVPPAAHKDVVGLAAFLDSGGALMRAHVPEDQ